MKSLHKPPDAAWAALRSDCARCAGLCCTALCFARADGFPADKEAGRPCAHLLPDFRCRIHEQLEQKGLKGCLGYDCFGAGQFVIQELYHGQSRHELPERAAEMCAVFTVVFRLQQIRYYLTEAAALYPAAAFAAELQLLLEENANICAGTPAALLGADVEAHRERANAVLKRVCAELQRSCGFKKLKLPAALFGKSLRGRDLSGCDLSGKLLIAADFTGCRFYGTILLGADTRDADLSDADLSEAAFLTQWQVNAAKGNRRAKLPPQLAYPVTWK